MKRSTFFSLFGAFILALVAVFGVREFLVQQRASIANNQPQDRTSISTIVVAAQPMRFGKVIEPQSLKTLEWPAEHIPEGAFVKVEDLLDAEGKPRYVMSSFEENEPIIASKITGAGQRATLSAVLSEGMKAVSIRVNDVLGVAGFVLPGDRVDIMLTHNRVTSTQRRGQVQTDVLLQGVRVLAVDQSADDRTDKPSVVKTVTFEVSTREAQKLTLATNIGTLSLALRNIASASVEEVDAININDLGGGPVSEALKVEKAKEVDVEKLVTEKIDNLKREFSEEKKQTVEYNLPVKDRYTSVGVYRGAEGRVDYKVKKEEEINFKDAVDIEKVSREEEVPRRVR